MASTSPRSPSGFEKLPAELYDEIFSHLPEPLEVNDQYSGPVTNRVINDYEMHGFEYLKGVRRDFRGYLQLYYLKLRLVSRAFNRAITRVWFQNEFLILRAFDYTGMFTNEEMAQPGNLDRRIIMPNSVNNINNFILQGQLLPQVLRRLRLEFSTYDSWHRERIQWLEPDCPESHPADRESLLAFLKVLPSALEKLERLECLWLNLTESWGSDYGGSGDGSAPQLDLVAVNELRNSLCSLFSPSYGHNFPFLTELRLALPCTYDFAVLNKAMSDEATRRLRHLYLEYVDATGAGGDNSYLLWAEDENGYDGDEGFPPSNLQEKYLNYDYMPDICILVGRCSNLESLGLHATHYLNLDELDWKPSGTGLRNIYIYRAMVHFDTLKKLLSAADGESSNIIAMKLGYVQLLDHAWVEIFDHLLRADAMKYFSIEDLNYAHRGGSAHLRAFNCRLWENCNTIWTENAVDQDRLQDIVKKILDAGGLVGRGLDDVAGQAGYDTNHPNSLNLISEW
ncbi:uncharacterized protein BDR25DRAFT_341510 [Lindgomyces ingoldianus]|uniref:Uncharacterized protein n=1 Tax=Lindgomyces ingoldianus TaxID=673940 RepID=A0ACB6R3Q3_9PLEO|nr:uncharacterized protein BDR25DRAFT_341510 [Lindgomyces ingoldianus]KAF2473453.1 hypothetical protein BDR25DRAFT_341510 [Lindgomyces ingoldianus]